MEFARYRRCISLPIYLQLSLFANVTRMHIIWIRDEFFGKSKSDWRKSWRRSVEEWFNKNYHYYSIIVMVIIMVLYGNYYGIYGNNNPRLLNYSIIILNFCFGNLWFETDGRSMTQWCLWKLQRWQAVLQGVSCERCWIRRRSWGAPDETLRYLWKEKA